MTSSQSSGSSGTSISFGYDSKNVFKYRDEHMCDKWNLSAQEKNLLSDVTALHNGKGNYVFNGKVKDYMKSMSLLQGIYVQFWAANPPDRRYSFPGSGLPFPNESVAFQETPNMGAVPVAKALFNFNIEYPNSYYTDMGRTLVPPQVKFRFVDSLARPMSKVYTVKLGPSIPYRSLTWTKKRNWNEGPLFFKTNLPCDRNQYTILQESAYPPKGGKEASNFWGLKPPK